MKEIGEYLRRIRESRNLSLKDVQEATKIRLCYLEAMERGDFEQIPGEVYRKGFIINFANAIGLNGQEVLQRYYSLKADQEEQIRLAQGEMAAEEKKQAGTSGDWIKGIYLGIAVILMGALLFSFFIFPFFRRAPLKEVGSHETTLIDQKDEMESVSDFPAPISVTAEFKARVWVQVKADGVLLFVDGGRVFEPTEPKQTWEAQQEMEINLGNPEGINLSFNGKYLELGPVKGLKKPKKIKLSPQGVLSIVTTP